MNPRQTTAMTITAAIEDFVREQEWDDEVIFDPESGESHLATVFEIDNQAYRLVVECKEEAEWLAVYIYPPFSVVAGKSVDAALFFNYLNDQYRYRGRITLDDEGRVWYKDIMDTDELTPSPGMVNNMLRSGINLFHRHFEAIAAIALTRKTYEAVRTEYDHRDAAAKKETKEGGNDGEA